MKTRLMLVITVAACGGAVCLGMGQKQTASGQGWTFNEEKNCLELSGAPESQSKIDKIIQALQHDKYPQNYRVATWKDGQKTLAIGQLKIEKATFSKSDASAKNNHLTGLTYQVGMCFTTCDPKCNQNQIDSKKLANEIRTLL
jgi:hypothetical protein